MLTFPPYLNKDTVERVYKFSQNFNVTLISVHRNEHSPDENEFRSRALQNDIRDHHMGFIPINIDFVEHIGTPEETHVHERNYLLLTQPNDSGNLKGFLLKHGRKYYQESVIFKPHDSEDAHLLTTSGPNKGTMSNLGTWHPSKICYYYNALRDGKTVTFESIRFVNAPSWFNRWEFDFNLVGLTLG